MTLMSFQGIARVVYVFFTERTVHVVRVAWDTKDIPTIIFVAFVCIVILYIFVKIQYINKKTKRDNIYPL